MLCLKSEIKNGRKTNSCHSPGWSGCFSAERESQSQSQLYCQMCCTYMTYYINETSIFSDKEVDMMSLKKSVLCKY